jgi:hypothetical protein
MRKNKAGEERCLIEISMNRDVESASGSSKRRPTRTTEE